MMLPFGVPDANFSADDVVTMTKENLHQLCDKIRDEVIAMMQEEGVSAQDDRERLVEIAVPSSSGEALSFNAFAGQE